MHYQYLLWSRVSLTYSVTEKWHFVTEKVPFGGQKYLRFVTFCDRKMTFCDSKMTFFDRKMTFCDRKMTFWDRKMTFCDRKMTFCDRKRTFWWSKIPAILANTINVLLVIGIGIWSPIYQYSGIGIQPTTVINFCLKHHKKRSSGGSTVSSADDSRWMSMGICRSNGR
jgi:hypothetical protein